MLTRMQRFGATDSQPANCPSVCIWHPSHRDTGGINSQIESLHDPKEENVNSGRSKPRFPAAMRKDCGPDMQGVILSTF
jgi:hypothetical protein